MTPVQAIFVHRRFDGTFEAVSANESARLHSYNIPPELKGFGDTWWKAILDLATKKVALTRENQNG
jgi:hypothetical protein